MKKLSAVFAVLMVMFSLVYFTNVSMANKASISLSAPVNGATNVATRPTFEYDLGGATGCTLRVSTSSDLSTSVTDISLTDGSISQKCDVVLSHSQQYFWNIKPNGGSFPTSGNPNFTVVP